MPVVRMRRTTRRVFGARVLRSGRRVMTSSPRETEHIKAAAARGAGGADWINALEGSRSLEKDENVVELDEIRIDGSNIVVSEKKWGIVYTRKRKRSGVSEDKKFGKFYVRKRRNLGNRVFGVLVELSCVGNGVLGGFLESVLRYMTRAELDLSRFSVFAMDGSFSRVYSSLGIRFLRDTSANKRSGVCKIFGASCYIPSFIVDFSALPSCFIYLHTTLFLRSSCLPKFLLSYPRIPVDTEVVRDDNMALDEGMVQIILQEPYISTSVDDYYLDIQNIPPVDVNPEKKSSLKITLRGPRTNIRSVQFKSGITTRSIQKRRSSLRSKRVRSPYPLHGRMTNDNRLSNLLSFKYDSFSLSAPVKSNLHLTFTKRNISNSPMKSSVVELTEEVGSSSCSGNVLVVESTKCYRIVGAVIKLEKTEKKWSLTVKKDGNTVYCLDARNIMRPSSINRVTHDIIWREENNNWKLEFPDRGDWLIFKDLYKECSERNMRVLPANAIPVPGVQEVPDYAETNNATFTRPDSYISVKDGELSRALAKSTAIYDMDTEDEEWVKKLNDISSLSNEHWDIFPEDTFEMIIDALEKGFFRYPEDYSVKKAAVDSCLHLERKEIVEAVYNYWIRKRKQRRSALVQVFQLYQPRRTQLLSKPFIRKKRSFKRQPSRSERTKQLTAIPLVVPEPDPVEEQKALLKVEEAKAATARSVDAAIEKRNKAQHLMEKADVATYKAAMALRIAEAALISESFGVSGSFLLEQI